LAELGGLAWEMLAAGERPARTVRETEAEAVTFVVCHAIGLDMGRPRLCSVLVEHRPVMLVAGRFGRRGALRLRTLPAGGGGPAAREHPRHVSD